MMHALLSLAFYRMKEYPQAWSSLGYAFELTVKDSIMPVPCFCLATLALDLADERLAKELAFAAERSDIAEETTRLDSHLRQFGDALNKPEAVGRSLDFLCQEMSREVNTLSAKTADTAISAHALTLKAELERIREQVQNIE